MTTESVEVFHEKRFKGISGRILILRKHSVAIKTGFSIVNLFDFYAYGEKSFPYSSIAAINFKRAGITPGFLQLTLKGEGREKQGLQDAYFDRSTVMFNNNDAFEEARDLLEERLNMHEKTDR